MHTCSIYEILVFCTYVLTAMEIPTGMPCNVHNSTSKAKLILSPFRLGLSSISLSPGFPSSFCCSLSLSPISVLRFFSDGFSTMVIFCSLFVISTSYRGSFLNRYASGSLGEFRNTKIIVCNYTILL